MGTWGFGHFDSDSAYGVLCDVVHFMEKRIDDEIRSINEVGILEPSGLAGLYCLLVFMRGMPDVRIIVQESKIGEWKAGMLAWRNECGKDLAAAGYSIEKIDRDIADVFQELEKLIKEGPAAESAI